ncbi:hypothetical protein Cni_G19927 [Canna indica]|uniref:C2H2-type domain-containing protein n=1 Tax=Canna indica TaxID=4628 RepID=A0AAQ3QFQ9_9LILI|nr:hypothetical protein Cni_G19927 [Canna indica]
MTPSEQNPLELPSSMAETRKHHHKVSKRTHKASKHASCPTMAEESGTSKTINTSSKKEASHGSSWGSLRNLFSCRYQQEAKKKKRKKICNKFRCSVSLCRMRDSSSALSPETISNEVGNKLASKSSFDTSSRYLKTPPSNDISGAISASFSLNSSASITTPSSSSSSSFSSLGGSFRAMHLRGFSECYECHLLVDPSMRLNTSPCLECGEIFMKHDDLELHQIEKHAVSELGAEDSSRKIIEIIFQSSWLKKKTPACKIDRILKVQNTQKTIARFEEHRDSIKSSADKLQVKNSRCIADGNELLRFYSTTSACSLALGGSTNLCKSTSKCDLCSILRGGFKADELGKIQTMATSGAAHEAAAAARISSEGDDRAKRAMLMCRVIAGRVKKSQDDAREGCYDSVAGGAGSCSDADELFVFSPNAILPCFVVQYRG